MSESKYIMTSGVKLDNNTYSKIQKLRNVFRRELLRGVTYNEVVQIVVDQYIQHRIKNNQDVE
jgi:hypothetical protein